MTTIAITVSKKKLVCFILYCMFVFFFGVFVRVCVCVCFLVVYFIFQQLIYFSFGMLMPGVCARMCGDDFLDF
jgi:hypothetical protein